MTSAKAELHNLVDQLDEDRAPEALVYLRRLLHNEQSFGPATAALTQRMQPQAVAGRAFLAQPSHDLLALAIEQGVRPVTDFDNLLGDFWPEDEKADEFVAAVRRWRGEGGYA
jgi:hypothetical protein